MDKPSRKFDFSSNTIEPYSVAVTTAESASCDSDLGSRKLLRSDSSSSMQRLTLGGGSLASFVEPVGRRAEVFRLDYISAIKMPEWEQPGDFLTLEEPWRQEWERGVQVLRRLFR